MRSWSGIFVVLAAAFALSAERASAVEIEFGWSGTVAEVEAGLAAALPPGSGVTVGAPVFVRYTFESTTPDSDGLPMLGDYQNAVVRWSLQVGDYVFTQDAAPLINQILVLFEFGLVIYEAVDSVVASPPLPGQSNLESDVFFLSFNSGQLPSDDLPLSQLDLDPTDTGWDTAAAGILDGMGTILIDVDLDAIDLPEPGLGLQLAVGVAFLAGVGRRRTIMTWASRSA